MIYQTKSVFFKSRKIYEGCPSIPWTLQIYNRYNKSQNNKTFPNIKYFITRIIIKFGDN